MVAYLLKDRIGEVGRLPPNRGTETRYANLRDTKRVSAVAPGVAFVGRGRELDALAAHLAAQGRLAGGVLLISGPAGVGVTRNDGDPPAALITTQDDAAGSGDWDTAQRKPTG
jgi:hypothetical protein